MFGYTRGGNGGSIHRTHSLARPAGRGAAIMERAKTGETRHYETVRIRKGGKPMQFP